eukprot:CAMPEP_0113569744 /NCGR_PEP_ID=MMETSP0015_2-20120614/24581_1 /TAXON_ID=2838 /ORGANISM="Odontella" /LENGTH=596 /DNA_ID=CAMNT_0000472443 /DNA_START=1954 /DNA_END=3744 /DNA_ORIENTATION=+ /assembly_acc=CAM_ASM_000160
MPKRRKKCETPATGSAAVRLSEKTNKRTKVNEDNGFRKESNFDDPRKTAGKFCALDFARDIVRHRSSVNDNLDSAFRKYPEAITSAATINRILDVIADQMKEISIATSICTWFLLHETIRKPLRVFGRIAKIFAAAGCWDMLTKTFDRMNECDIDGKVKVYNIVITDYGSRSENKEAELLYSRMRAEGIRPDQGTLKSMLKVCEKMRMGSRKKEDQPVEKALGYLKEFRASIGGNIDSDCYIIVINMSARSGNWQMALKILDEAKENTTRYTKKMMEELYHSSMLALQHGMQWEKTLDLFEEMRSRKLATTQSYTIAISACEKGLQWQQCLQYLDDMERDRVQKNEPTYGIAVSCMAKAGLVDIIFQLLDQMKSERIVPSNIALNTAIQACAHCSNSENNLWKKGYDIFLQIEKGKDPVDLDSYNAVLDALSFQTKLSLDIFRQGLEKGIIRPSSHVESASAKLDLHLLSLGAAEVCLRWWFEEHLLERFRSPRVMAKLKAVDVVTGWGKSRVGEKRKNEDGIKKRVATMISFYGLSEIPQSNKGMISIDISSLRKSTEDNGGKLIFDVEGYFKWKKMYKELPQNTKIPQVMRKSG